MADIKLFRFSSAAGSVQELQGTSVQLEKSLQTLIERNLEQLLGVRFLASELTTSKRGGGRIDTIGIDENSAPVIIEYKRGTNENVISQGLFYLDWLLDHKADFSMLVTQKLGNEVAAEIDWASPRLICIAGDFNRYDEHAIQQIDRNIELIRYKRFADDLLLFELVNATTGAVIQEGGEHPTPGRYRTPTQALLAAEPTVRDIFEAMKAFLLSLGDDVQFREAKHYFAFKRLKNFATAEIYSDKMRVWVKVPPASITLEPGFTRDVSNIGHRGTGDLEITMSSMASLDRAKPLLLQSYEKS